MSSRVGGPVGGRGEPVAPAAPAGPPRPPGAAGPARCAAGRSAGGTATVISQPRGLSGTPVGRPLRRGGQQRLLHRVLGGVEVPVPADQRAEDLRRQLAQQVLDVGGRSRRRGRQPSRSSTPSRTGRTSTYSPSASGLTKPRGDLDGPVEARALDDRVAGEHLLGLRVRPVGDHRRAARAAAPGGRAPARSAPGRRPARRTPPASGAGPPCTRASPRPARATSPACRWACRPARRSPAASRTA